MKEGDKSEETRNKAESIDNFNLLQYEQASNAYRDQLSHLIKLTVMFITIDVILTGYGIQSQQTFPFLLAAICGITLIVVVNSIYRLTIPALCIGVELELRATQSEEGKPLNNQMVSTMVLQELGGGYLQSLRAIAEQEKIEERAEMLGNLPTPIIGPKVRQLCAALALISVSQLIVFIHGLSDGWLPPSPSAIPVDVVPFESAD